MHDLHVRRAGRFDLPVLLSLIREMAQFAGQPGSVKATVRKLDDSLFADPPRAHALLAEIDGETVGYALYFETFSSFLADPCLWLDDLYVRPGVRRQGVGSALMDELSRVAEERGCARIEWIVLKSNARGLSFYRKRGAQVDEKHHICRVTSGA